MMLIGELFLLVAASTAAQDAEAPPIDYPALPNVAAKAEDFASAGWVVVSRVEGDLNRDGRADLALALWTGRAANAKTRDEILESPPYRLVIAFAQPNGSYRLIAENKNLILAPDGWGNIDALASDDLRIVRGSLDISRQLLRGHYRYRFRWSNGAFRLIGYDYGGSDGHCVTLTSINFLTRRASIEVEALSEEGGGSKVTRTTKRGPLATLERVSSEEFWPEQLIVGKLPDCP